MLTVDVSGLAEIMKMDSGHFVHICLLTLGKRCLLLIFVWVGLPAFCYANDASKKRLLAAIKPSYCSRMPEVVSIHCREHGGHLTRYPASKTYTKKMKLPELDGLCCGGT